MRDERVLRVARGEVEVEPLRVEQPLEGDADDSADVVGRRDRWAGEGQATTESMQAVSNGPDPVVGLAPAA